MRNHVHSSAVAAPVDESAQVERGYRLDRAMLHLCIADLMFLPYLRIFDSSISLLILPLWIAYRAPRLGASQKFRIFIFVAALVFINLMLLIVFRSNSPDLFGGEGVYSGVVNSVILLYMFGIFFMARYVIFHNTVRIERWLLAYLGFVGSLALVFYFDAQLYFSIRSIWTMGGTQILFDQQGHWHRFTGTLSDPNNVAIIISAVLAFLLFNMRIRPLIGLLAAAIVVVVVTATMSRSGFLAAIFVLIAYGVWISLRYLSRGLVIRIAIFILFNLTLLFIVFQWVGGTEVGRLFGERLGYPTGRIDRWVQLLDLERFVKSIFLGQGGVVFGDYGIIKPHNGHLHLFLAFGFMVYIYFLYIFFVLRGRQFSNYLFAIVLLFGFTVNVGIYEPRFAGLMALMVGAYAALYERNGRQSRISFR